MKTIIIGGCAALLISSLIMALAFSVSNMIHLREEAQLYIGNGNKITVKAGEDANCFRSEATQYTRWCPTQRRVYCPLDEKTMTLDCSKAIMP